jgi:hypothetical protein
VARGRSIGIEEAGAGGRATGGRAGRRDAQGQTRIIYI